MEEELSPQSDSNGAQAKSSEDGEAAFADSEDSLLARQLWLRRLRWIGWASWEAALVLMVAGACLAQRLLELEPIEIGGDALKVWEFARSLVHGADFPNHLNHHTSRFGLVLPSIVSQKLFGSAATSYYVGPLSASVVMHLCLYLSARYLSGPVAGAIAVLFLLSFEPLVRASSQILPESFGPAYTAAAYLFALYYTGARARWSKALLLGLVAVAMFGAYGSKMSYLFFAPGLAFLVWFGVSKESPAELRQEPQQGTASSRVGRLWQWAQSRGLVVPGLLALGVLALIGVETLFHAGATDASGRISVVTGSHRAGGAKPIREFADFFRIYRVAPAYWSTALFGGAIATIGTLGYVRDKRAKLYALGFLFFLLLQTFIVRSLSPLTPWTEPHPRYLTPLAGPFAVLLGVFVASASQQGAAIVTRRWKSRPRALGRCLGFLAASALLAQVVAPLSHQWERKWGKRDQWHQTLKESEDLTAAFVAGIPIVSDSPQAKPVWAAGAVFVQPAAMMKDGVLQPRGKFTRRYKKGRRSGKYLAQAVAARGVGRKALDQEVTRRLKSRRCVLRLRQQFRFMRGVQKVSGKCLPLAQEAKQRAKKANQKKRSRKGRGKASVQANE